jgi:hypothetical protein
MSILIIYVLFLMLYVMHIHLVTTLPPSFNWKQNLVLGSHLLKEIQSKNGEVARSPNPPGSYLQAQVKD